MAERRPTRGLNPRVREAVGQRQRAVSIAPAARGLDLDEAVLRRWLNAYRADPQPVSAGPGEMEPEQRELERLRCELMRPKADRDILRRIAARFAKDPT